ncbi:MAG: CoA transferase [Candidatus Binatia bacterium]
MLRAYSKSAGTGKRRERRRSRSDGRRVAADYGAALLASLDIARPDRLHELARDDVHPALAWAASGSMALTGTADGPPALAPGHLAAAAHGAASAFAALAQASLADTLDGAALLGERAALLGLSRRGTTSAGGHCRLVRARDGWIAVNLPRPDDLATVPAWLERACDADPWETITHAAGERAAASLVARGRLLGLAVAPAAPPADVPTPWCRVAAQGDAVSRDDHAPPLVVDLSSLWAGPLAAHLLQRAGARVVKIESAHRPDGTHRGPAPFFDLLHAGKESVVLDFTTAAGGAALRRLIARADIVIDSARPRATAHLGVDPAVLVRARPGLTWISITGYGRTGHGKNWIAFGDDAASAAGLAHATGTLADSATPLFCGDAIADPLTGLHAAVAALGAHRQGGGVLLALALRDVAAHAVAFGPSVSPATVHTTRRQDGAPEETVTADGVRQAVLPPRARPSLGAARPFGADTDAVLRALDVH